MSISRTMKGSVEMKNTEKTMDKIVALCKTEVLFTQVLKSMAVLLILGIMALSAENLRITLNLLGIRNLFRKTNIM